MRSESNRTMFVATAQRQSRDTSCVCSILAVVEDQFYDVRKRLDAQLTRTTEIQQQLEGQRKEIAELRRTVNLAHRLLKELLARIP